MMKNVIIIGSGAVASEITMYLRDIEEVVLKGYLEYEYNLDNYYNKYHFEKPILGSIDDYEPQENDYFIIGVSHIGFRKTIIEVMKSKGAIFYTLIHPTAIISCDAKIGEGCVISPFCIIGPKAIIGDYNEFTSYSCVSHDCIIGSNNSFSSSIICGRVIVGNNNSFYIRSIVQPDITIGNNCIIQAAMSVDKDVEDDSVVYYRFKEKCIAVPKGGELNH